MWVFVITVVALAAAYVMGPKPQQQQTAEAGTVQAPVASEGVDIPVLFGTRDINSPNTVWYGDIKTVAVKKKGGKK